MRKDSNDLVTAAQSYLSAGFSVIALVGKVPNGLVHRHGLDQALVGIPEDKFDDALVESVFTSRGTTGIGIVIPDHLVVVDIDGEDGARQYQALVTEAPETPVAQTSRGLHVWYLTPKVRHSAKLGPKLDLKGVGGYVVVPPSVHPGTGHVYRWLEPLVDEESGQPAHIDWLPDAIEAMFVDADEPEEPPEFKTFRIDAGTWQLVDEEPDLGRLTAFVRRGESGERNNRLAWATFRFKDAGVPRETALKDLGEAGLAAGLTPREVRATIRSVYRRQDAH